MIKATVKWDDSGFRNLEREVMTRAREHMKREARQRLQRVRCTTHGKTPTFRFTETAKGVTVNIDGCCDDVVKQAEAAFKN